MNNLKNNVINKASAFADAYGLIPVNTHIVIGLSGGPDSVFLLHLLHALRHERNLTLYAAHLNHEWRGAAAEEDALFCKKMAADLDISYVQARLTELPNAPQYEGSYEAQGRIARRQFLTEVQHKTNANVIALAHHADDQQETFFIRLVRGASLAGLVGMAPKAEQYIRPLLSLHKRQIVAWLQAQNIPYRDDLSNYEQEYLRNRIRATVLPALKAVDERFDHSFEHTLSRLQETEDYLRHTTETLFSHIALQDKNHFILNKEKLIALHPAIQERLLVYWLCIEKVPFPPAYGFLREIIRFIELPNNGTHAIHHAWTLTKKGNTISLSM